MGNSIENQENKTYSSKIANRQDEIPIPNQPTNMNDAQLISQGFQNFCADPSEMAT